jgi:hypothetical protein
MIMRMACQGGCGSTVGWSSQFCEECEERRENERYRLDSDDTRIEDENGNPKALRW